MGRIATESYGQEMGTPGARDVLCSLDAVLEASAVHDLWPGMGGTPSMLPRGRTLPPSPRPTALAPPRHLPPDGATARGDVPVGESAVADEGLPPLGLPAVSIRGEEQGHCHGNCLSEEPLGSLTEDLG
jgi:hypothetical protein